MNAVPLALDGYLDTIPEPDDGGTTARFRLVSSPTDDVEDEAIVPCTAKDPTSPTPCSTRSGPVTWCASSACSLPR
ncbi:hypothetical protein [Streptomyces mirabilis]|jgi:hypothetical protein|uniref:hypothetical protein n=1 Tax=Streptomyces mirabilis TaxID=68239 RepID=UPI00224FB72B|nr:hypothetical protein [Streptomyces mirabilis]MCX4616479.1 hypothetical protein [Streptomyces mirabilis]MCX5346763.1 hypothetical protein [Streptomyces mirabilis]